MRSGFTKQQVPGSQVDFSTGTPKVLSTEDIGKYEDVDIDEVQDALARETALAIEDEPV